MNDLRITLIQADLFWENPVANMSLFEEKVRPLVLETDLIILPEMFTTGFTMNAESLGEPPNLTTFRWMAQMAEFTGAVVSGSYIVKEKQSYFNRFLAVYPDGSSKKYDKKHLFGLAGEDGPFTAGNERLVFDVKGWKVFPQICYDLRFPVWSRSRRNGIDDYEYDLMLYVASWPKPRINAWDTLLQARAIENISYCAGVNRLGTDGSKAEYIGHSACYDYLGNEVCSLGEQAREETISLSASGLAKFRDRFPFQKDSDSFEFS